MKAAGLGHVKSRQRFVPPTPTAAQTAAAERDPDRDLSPRSPRRTLAELLRVTPSGGSHWVCFVHAKVNLRKDWIEMRVRLCDIRRSQWLEREGFHAYELIFHISGFARSRASAVRAPSSRSHPLAQERTLKVVSVMVMNGVVSTKRRFAAVHWVCVGGQHRAPTFKPILDRTQSVATPSTELPACRGNREVALLGHVRTHAGPRNRTRLGRGNRTRGRRMSAYGCLRNRTHASSRMSAITPIWNGMYGLEGLGDITLDYRSSSATQLREGPLADHRRKDEPS
jgi:hypothetical protein